MSRTCSSYPCSDPFGSAGGYLEVDTGNALEYSKLTIPANALSSTVTIGVAMCAGTPALPTGYTVLSKAYEYTPHNQTFALKVSVALGFDTSLPNYNASKVRLFISNHAILDPLGWMPIPIGDCIFDADRDPDLDYGRVQNFTKWYFCIGQIP
jgi:hypothetical protein